MNALDPMNSATSRPKIHKLPSSLSSKKRSKSRGIKYFIRNHIMSHANKGVRMAVLLVTVSAALFVTSRLLTSPGNGNAVLEVAHLEPSAGDAMASIPQMQAVTANSQTIHIKGNQQAIIGQLARIPSESGNISDIKTVSEVDNRAGRELLSIISKY